MDTRNVHTGGGSTFVSNVEEVDCANTSNAECIVKSVKVRKCAHMGGEGIFANRVKAT
jgi:hypothetical protein